MACAKPMHLIVSQKISGGDRTLLVLFEFGGWLQLVRILMGKENDLLKLTPAPTLLNSQPAVISMPTSKTKLLKTINCLWLKKRTRAM